jgi:acyl carrier protein
MEKSIEQRVTNIIVEQLGVHAAEIKPDSKFIDDLGADSLDVVELTMAFEEEFDIELPDEVVEKLDTVGKVIEYLEKQVK